MTLVRPRPLLSAQAVHRLVDQWRAALVRQASAEELLPHLANGLLVELPGRTVRGKRDFRSWYRDTGGHAALSTLPHADDVHVRPVSPVHAHITFGTSPTIPDTVWAFGAAGAQDSAHQSWWVVMQQDGVPRIRTVAVHRTGPVPAALPAARVPAGVAAV